MAEFVLPDHEPELYVEQIFSKRKDLKYMIGQVIGLDAQNDSGHVNVGIFVVQGQCRQATATILVVQGGILGR
jgi:hypothetical protein